MPVRVWPGIPTGPSYNGKDGSLLKSRSGFEFQWAFHSFAVRGRIARAIEFSGAVLLPVRSTGNGWRAGEERLAIPVFALTGVAPRCDGWICGARAVLRATSA